MTILAIGWQSPRGSLSLRSSIVAALRLATDLYPAAVRPLFSSSVSSFAKPGFMVVKTCTQQVPSDTGKVVQTQDMLYNVFEITVLNFQFAVPA